MAFMLIVTLALLAEPLVTVTELMLVVDGELRPKVSIEMLLESDASLQAMATPSRAASDAEMASLTLALTV